MNYKALKLMMLDILKLIVIVSAILAFVIGMVMLAHYNIGVFIGIFVGLVLVYFGIQQYNHHKEMLGKDK